MAELRAIQECQARENAQKRWRLQRLYHQLWMPPEKAIPSYPEWREWLTAFAVACGKDPIVASGVRVWFTPAALAVTADWAGMTYSEGLAALADERLSKRISQSEEEEEIPKKARAPKPKQDDEGGPVSSPSAG